MCQAHMLKTRMHDLDSISNKVVRQRLGRQLAAPCCVGCSVVLPPAQASRQLLQSPCLLMAPPAPHSVHGKFCAAGKSGAATILADTAWATRLACPQHRSRRLEGRHRLCTTTSSHARKGHAQQCFYLGCLRCGRAGLDLGSRGSLHGVVDGRHVLRSPAAASARPTCHPQAPVPCASCSAVRTLVTAHDFGS